MDPFHSGLLVLAVFVGNLTIKPATTPLIRWLGFRRLLLINGALNVCSLLACALLTPQTPVWAIMLILYLGGVFRSIQFTGVSTLAFADVPAAQMSDANTLFSTASQLAVGLGITLGAIGIRLGEQVCDWLHLTGTTGDQLPPVVCVYRLDLSGRDDRQPASGQNGRQQRVGEEEIEEIEEIEEKNKRRKVPAALALMTVKRRSGEQSLRLLYPGSFRRSTAGSVGRRLRFSPAADRWRAGYRGSSLYYCCFDLVEDPGIAHLRFFAPRRIAFAVAAGKKAFSKINRTFSSAPQPKPLANGSDSALPLLIWANRNASAGSIQ